MDGWMDEYGTSKVEENEIKPHGLHLFFKMYCIERLPNATHCMRC